MIPNVQLLKNQGACYRAENTVSHISVASTRAKNNNVGSAELIYDFEILLLGTMKSYYIGFSQQ